MSSLHGRQARAVVLFLVLLGVFHGIYQLERRTTNRFLDRPFTRVVTTASQAVGERLLPFPVVQQGGSILATERAAVVVRGGCNGVETLFLMIAGVLAVPAPAMARIKTLATALPLLFALNLPRVVGLLWVMVAHPDFIGVAHDQIAQGMMVVAVLVLWLRHLGRDEVAAIRLA